MQLCKTEFCTVAHLPTTENKKPSDTASVLSLKTGVIRGLPFSAWQSLLSSLNLARLDPRYRIHKVSSLDLADPE